MVEAAMPRQHVPDVSSRQRAVNALTKLERKLRWIGMEDEAREVQRQLSRCGPADTLPRRLDGR
jgi:hypothetical protein